MTDAVKQALSQLGMILTVDTQRGIAMFEDGWLRIDERADGHVLSGLTFAAFPSSGDPETAARFARAEATLLVSERDWWMTVRAATPFQAPETRRDQPNREPPLQQEVRDLEKLLLLTRFSARALASCAPGTPALVDEVQAISARSERAVKDARPDHVFGDGRGKFARVGPWLDELMGGEGHGQSESATRERENREQAPEGHPDGAGDDHSIPHRRTAVS